MSASIEHSRVDTRVGTLHVETRGSGPAVLCWPSLYCDARSVDPLVEDLARDHRVVVIDPPGHGRSGTIARAHTCEEAAMAGIQVLDALGIERALWIGPAWGGHVGIVAAQCHRERLAGLVVLNAPMAPWSGRKLALMRLAYALLWLFGPRSFVATMLADSMIGPSAGPDRRALVELIVAGLHRCNRRRLLWAVRSAMFERGDLRPRLPEVRVPTLFIAGAEDSLLTVEDARRDVAAIPDCRFVVAEHSAHQSALEAPSLVIAVVRDAMTGWSTGDLRASS